ncbi:dienelactone hydrolase [Methylobacterium variabile]|jgi:carboxymethylenebutenolidase|uniref:Dienelactone hydrolase n=1 Tax=Methylobacterium variabile TaxID=298794 RepID=A0A0J6SHY6_9HYPH|nr:dienelactone hydrolase family protein [Methylobacterium variabile]KMO32963.1 dienelactone hydrolase [Methylobacterium variabile]
MLSFTSAGTPIEVEWFAARASGDGPAVLLLHGADGLTFADGYRLAARSLAASGYHVAFLHYLDRTNDRRVAYARLRHDFPLWAGTVRDGLNWLAQRPGVDAGRLGLVGVSLGAALAFDTAASDARVRAIVDYFGPLPDGLAARRPRLPPTLVLHGARDPVVPVSQAHAIARLLAEQGTPHELQVYPDQGHGLTGAAQLDAAARTARFLDRHVGLR